MCIFCVSDIHEECETPNEVTVTLDNVSAVIYTCCCGDIASTAPVGNKLGAPLKENANVRDIESTGRKRAAVAYPITEGMECEWSGIKYAGGGVNSIIGCYSNPARDIHHGPDKSTLNNGPDNVHRICSTCHHRWHTLNDDHYGSRPKDGSAFLPTMGLPKEHDGLTKATNKEIFENEIAWKTGKMKALKPESKALDSE